jgi:hypothetical protein
MNLENIRLSERCQSQKVMYYITPLNEVSRIKKSMKTESPFVFALVGGMRVEIGSDC